MNLLKKKINKITWYVPLELNHSSYIYTSVLEYCKRNAVPFEISLKNKNSRSKIIVDKDGVIQSNDYFPKVCWIKVTYTDRRSKHIAFDLDDNPNVFARQALEKCDVYFKRCYQESICNTLEIAICIIFYCSDVF